MIQLHSDELEVSVLTKGAEVCSVKSRGGREFMWQGDRNVWPRHAPVLFPIVGRLKDNRLIHEGNSFEITQHGFARDMDFECISHSDQQAIFRLRSDEHTLNMFPFEFILDISYRLEGNILETSYKVTNLSQGRMYFSIGAHPGFSLPLSADSVMEDHYLQFQREDLWVTPLKEGFLGGEKQHLHLRDGKLQLSNALFENDALIFENGQVELITLCSSKGKGKIHIECSTWPSFGVWSKKGCRDFICLEPWYGITDPFEGESREFQNKKGILRLEKGLSFHCAYKTHFFKG